MLKASKIVKHYGKASDCAAYVMGSEAANLHSVCTRCKERNCSNLHIEAANKARKLGGSYIYVCQKSLVFWTSPFYSGERYAGSFFSGGVRKTEKNNKKVKALAQIMLLCADQVTKASSAKKITISKLTDNDSFSEPSVVSDENQKTYNNSCPLDMERMLLASLRRGDNIEAKKILVKLLKILYFRVKENFPAFRLKALELAVLLSRAVADPKDIEDNTSLEATNRCLNKIGESRNFDEITETLCAITEQMSGMIFSFHGVRHFSALRKAERYIWTNYTRKLSLREIANASGLSAPYFSTVFKEEMGENLSNYLNRLRVEKAAAMLATTDLPIYEVATACGFEDQSWFSKIFKNNTGFTPGKYRESGMTGGGMDTKGITLN